MLTAVPPTATPMINSAVLVIAGSLEEIRSGKYPRIRNY